MISVGLYTVCTRVQTKINVKLDVQRHRGPDVNLKEDHPRIRDREDPMLDAQA